MLQLKPEGMPLADVVSQPVAVCGRQLIADNSGALYWPSQRTLLVADLPLQDSSAGAGGAGNGASPRHTNARQALVRLAETLDRYDPAMIVVLGVGSDDTAGVARLAPEDLEVLGILQEDRTWVWVTGLPVADAAPQLGGSVCGELEISGIVLRRRPTPGWATHEIAGAMRPAARFSMYGYDLRRACFVGNGRRLLMPAFGAVAGGLNVLDDAFRPLFPDGRMAVWMLGHEALYPVAPRFLAGD
jgi:metallophosphoesterase superfamily enzyme